MQEKFLTNSTLFHDKTPSKLGEMYLNIIKILHDKCTANIILSDEKLTGFPLRSVTRQRCPLSLLLFTVVLKV